MNAISHPNTLTSTSVPQQQSIYDARLLTQGNPCATILLDNQTYVLRITKAGKLILTK